MTTHSVLGAILAAFVIVGALVAALEWKARKIAKLIDQQMRRHVREDQGD